MTRSRFGLITILAVVLAITVIPAVRAENQSAAPSWFSALGSLEKPGSKTTLTCTIYALAELGDDPALGKWVAETIPEVIEPGSWSCSESAARGDSRPRLRYYAPGKVLVVFHTAAVHGQVNAFLKDVKKSLAAGKPGTTAQSGKTISRDPAVMPASYSAPALIRTAESGCAETPGYPVPAARQAPRHLFHFIIRYEGEGIVDSNVADMLKNIYMQKSAEEDKAKCTPPSLSKPMTATAESSLPAPLPRAIPK